MDVGYKLDKPVALSCPECGGTLRRDKIGPLTQYVCHIGHVLSPEAAFVAQFAALEWRLAGSLALLNERAELCRQLAELARSRNEDDTKFRECEKQTLERADRLRKLLADEWQQPVME
jgi:two-component system chemotaxis response regulator CheB